MKTLTYVELREALNKVSQELEQLRADPNTQQVPSCPNCGSGGNIFEVNKYISEHPNLFSPEERDQQDEDLKALEEVRAEPNTDDDEYLTPQLKQRLDELTAEMREDAERDKMRTLKDAAKRKCEMMMKYCDEKGVPYIDLPLSGNDELDEYVKSLNPSVSNELTEKEKKFVAKHELMHEMFRKKMDALPVEHSTEYDRGWMDGKDVREEKDEQRIVELQEKLDDLEQDFELMVQQRDDLRKQLKGSVSRGTNSDRNV